MAAHWSYASCVGMCWTDVVAGLVGAVVVGCWFSRVGLGVCCISTVESDSVVEKETFALSVADLTSTSDVSKVMLIDVGWVIFFLWLGLAGIWVRLLVCWKSSVLLL